MEKKEIDLIKRAQGGDKKAFAALYEKYFEKIYRYCSFNTKSREDAQDVASETFVKAWGGVKNFDINSKGTFQAYLFQIARNLIIDASRKKSEEKIDDPESFQSGEDLLEKFSEKQRKGRIRKALEKLDETDRQIIILRYFEEMSYEEIADVTGIKSSALRVRIHRLLKKISVIYKNDRTRN